MKFCLVLPTTHSAKALETQLSCTFGCNCGVLCPPRFPGFDVGEMLQVIKAAAEGVTCPSPTLGFTPVTGL